MPIWAQDVLAVLLFVVFGGGYAYVCYTIMRCNVPGCWSLMTHHYSLDVHGFVCERHWEASQRPS